MAGWEAGQPCSKGGTSHTGLGSRVLRHECPGITSNKGTRVSCTHRITKQQGAYSTYFITDCQHATLWVLTIMSSSGSIATTFINAFDLVSVILCGSGSNSRVTFRDSSGCYDVFMFPQHTKRR